MASIRLQFWFIAPVVATVVTALTVPAVACAQTPSTEPAHGMSTSAEKTYPSRPMRLISAGQVGGSPDIIARLIAAEMSRQIAQQVVVDNRPGAGGIISLEIVARAAPDGYTIGQTTSNFVTNRSLYAKLPYDSEKDFEPVVFQGSGIHILSVTPSLPIRTVKELIVHARANPGKLSYGGLGVGSIQVLTMELFKFQTASNIVFVAYKSIPQAINDIISGQIHLICDPATSSLPFVRAGKLRGLGVTSLKRSAAAPELPTLDEAGVPGYEATFRVGGFVLPAKTPHAIVLRLNAEINKAMQSPLVAEKLAANGNTGGGGTPEHYAELLRAETAKWAKVIKAMGITPN